MNNTNANVERINKFGRACRIITKIGMILSIIGAVLALIGTIGVLSLPQDFITFSGNADASVTVQLKNGFLTDAGLGMVSNDDELKINLEADSVIFEDILTFKVDEVDVNENSGTYHLTSDLSEINTQNIKNELAIEIVSGLLLSVTSAIFLFFACKLSKSIEICETPFTEEIITNIKKFGYSLIPFAVLGGIADGSVFAMCMFVLVIIMLVNVFAYGAELQKESDELL